MIPLLLEVLTKVRLEMQLGRSVAFSLNNVLGPRKEQFCKSLEVWLRRIEAGQNHGRILESLPELACTPSRRHFLGVLERGLRGSSIDSALAELEKEFFLVAENKFERQIQLLPIKMMLPLTLFILPSVILLLIAPLFSTLRGGL